MSRGDSAKESDLINECQAAYYMVLDDLQKNITSRDQLQDGKVF